MVLVADETKWGELLDSPANFAILSLFRTMSNTGKTSQDSLLILQIRVLCFYVSLFSAAVSFEFRIIKRPRVPVQWSLFPSIMTFTIPVTR